jgi:hypothetical protein
LPAVERTVGENEIAGVGEVAEERHLVDDGAAIKYVNNRFTVADDNALRRSGSAANQILQYQSIAGGKSRNFSADRERTGLGYAATCVAIGSDEVDGLASAHADPATNHQHSIAVNIDIAAAGDGDVAGEIGGGRPTAAGADDSEGAVILEELLADAAAGSGAGEVPIGGGRPGGEIVGAVYEYRALIHQAERAGVLADAAHVVIDRPGAGAGAGRLLQRRRHVDVIGA